MNNSSYTCSSSNKEEEEDKTNGFNANSSKNTNVNRVNMVKNVLLRIFN
jgi:hypothetical protein